MNGFFTKRDVRLVLFIGSTLLLVMQLPGYFSQKHSSGWQSQFSDSQSELAWLSASMLLEHNRLQEELWRYVNVTEGADKSQVLKQLDSYMGRFDVLGDLIAGHLEQLERLDEIAGEPAIESSVFQTSVKNLQISGLPTLRNIEKIVQGIQPNGYNDLLLVHSELSDLSKQVTRFLLGGFEFSRQLNDEQEKWADRLNQRLWYSQFSVIYGILLFGLALFVYLREKQQTATMLETTNRKLENKISESQRLALELEQRASRDGLSGLLNRCGFRNELREVLDSKSGFHGLCFMDIDMFKIVNDTSGHTAGDTLIQTIAQFLKDRTGEDDIVARFGGDEFLIMIKDCEKFEFEQTIIGLCEDMRSLGFAYCGKRFDVSGSFGAVHFDAAEQSRQSLMAIVDAACYEAKRAGGARIHFHGDDDSIVQARRSDVNLINDIQRALSNDEFMLFYQPMHSLDIDHGSRLHGWEVLLRMENSEGEIVLPHKILGVAERFSFAPKIDRWVVQHVFKWLNSLPLELERISCLNINLSGKSVGDIDFLKFLEAETESLLVDTGRVCFEITETAVAGPHAVDFITRLKELGYQLALDDFGTGFSSFGYLETLPVDYIKIDGLFVRDINKNKTHEEFVKAISVVGRAMGKSVAAEFVSNNESVEILKRLGVEYAQGFHLGHPSALPIVPECNSGAPGKDLTKQNGKGAFKQSRKVNDYMYV